MYVSLYIHTIFDVYKDWLLTQGKITGISYCRDGFWLRDNLGVWCKANIWNKYVVVIRRNVI